MSEFAETRVFQPSRVDTLREECKPWIGKEVTVRSWHENIAMKKTHPDDSRVGYVVEFGRDIPASELK